MRWREQYVFRQETGTDLVIRFPDEEWAGTYRGKTILYDPHDQVRPKITLESITRLDADRWRYRYRVCNDSSAKDPIESITLRAPISQGPICMVHRQSGGFRAPCPNGVPVSLNQDRSEYGLPYLGFTAPGLGNGIQPGRCASDLDVESDFLPGIAVMLFSAFYVRLDPDRLNWPDRVYEQAFKGVDHSWYGPLVHHVRPAIPPRAMLPERIASFREGLANMVRDGTVNGDHAAINEIGAALDELEKLESLSETRLLRLGNSAERDVTLEAVVAAIRVTFDRWIKK